MNEKQSEKVCESVAEMSSEATCKSILEEKPHENTNESNNDTDIIQKTKEHEEIIKSACKSSNLDVDSKLKEELQLEGEKQSHTMVCDNTDIENVQSIINEIDETPITSVDTFEDRMIKNLLGPEEESVEESFSTNFESRKIEDNLKKEAYQILTEKKEDSFSIDNEICNKKPVDGDDVKDKNKNERMDDDKVKEFDSEEKQSSDKMECEVGTELLDSFSIDNEICNKKPVDGNDVKDMNKNERMDDDKVKEFDSEEKQSSDKMECEVGTELLDSFSIDNEICNKKPVDGNDVKDMNKNERMDDDKVKEFDSEEKQSSDKMECEVGTELLDTRNTMNVNETNTLHTDTGTNKDEEHKYNDGINELKVKNTTNIEFSIDNKVNLNKISDVDDQEIIADNISVSKDNLEDTETMSTNTDEAIDSNVTLNMESLKSDQKDIPCNKESKCEEVDNIENVINKEQNQLQVIKDAESNTCKDAIEKADKEEIASLNTDKESNDLSDSCLKQNEQDFKSSIGNESYDSREGSNAKDITDIPALSNISKAIRKDLDQVTIENDTQDSNNEDDKIELRWDDDDELEDSKMDSEDTPETGFRDPENSSLHIESIKAKTSNNQYLPLTEHGLNKPDMMLEIPTQDFIEFSDEDDAELTAKFEMSPDMEVGDLDASNKSVDDGEETNNVCQQNVEVDCNAEIKNNNNIGMSEELSDKKDCKENDNTNEENNKNTLEKKSAESVDLDEKKLLKGIQDLNDCKESTIGDNKIEIKNTEKDAEIEMAIKSIVESSCTEENAVEICFKTGSEPDSSEITTVQKKNPENASNELVEPQPSTSSHNNQHSTLENIPQDCDVVEMSDSLGLLAESSRVMEDDEEQEDDEEVDEDDDFDVDDDNSNQMTVENSEDSNAHHSEADSKDVKDDTPSASDKETSGDGMNFAISTIVTVKDKNNEEETEEIVIEEALKEVEIEEEMITIDQANDEEDTEEPVEIAMDIETVKLSDTSDTEIEAEKEEINASAQPEKSDEVEEALKVKEEGVDDAPTTEFNRSVLTFVDLEGSSSDDDIQEVKKKDASSETVTTVKMPAHIDVISSSAGTTSDIVMKDTETVISGLPKPPRLKPARLNTSEVSIKTTNNSVKASPKVIPDAEVKFPQDEEVFNLDSDDEEPASKEKEEIPAEKKRNAPVKCLNKSCRGEPPFDYVVADARAVAYYEGDKKRLAYVCYNCNESVLQWNQEVIDGIRNFKPLLELDLSKYHEDLVEISDSESEDEEPPLDTGDLIGASAAKFLEDNLTDIFNEVWTKYKMDDRLDETKAQVQEELRRLEKECQEIDESFKECQIATDRLRNELYATFELESRQERELTIFDTSEVSYTTTEEVYSFPETRQSKRRSSLATEPPAKRPAIPLGYEPLHSNVNIDDQKMAKLDKMDDDNTDISVVKLSVEAAPPDLPPPGPVTRALLKPGMQVYARKKASWLTATIMEVTPKHPNDSYTTCRVRFDHRPLKDPYHMVSGRCLAYHSPAEARLIIGTRVIALFKENGMKESFSAGIVAEVPNPVNNYRYLIFFDDGYAQYAPHAQLRLVCESSALVWEEVHADSRQFVKDYITSYPERPMVRLHAGQNLKTEYRGKWWASMVERVDASLVQVVFHESRRREWIYRGSTRLAPLFLELQAAERQRPRALPRAQPTAKGNMPYVEYTRSSEQTPKPAEPRVSNTEQEMRHQRSVAKKSTAASQPPPTPANNLDHVTSRVVFYTPKNAVKPYKISPHACSPRCRRTDVLQLKDLRTYNPLAKPLLSGWERQVVRWKGNKQVMYVGPCGRRLRDVRELHRYLRVTASDMPVDLFDFSPLTHCLAEFVLNKCIVAKKDLSHGKENVPVPCVNYYDDRLPEFCSYNTERTPTAGVPLNLDPEFLCGCDCEDDCEDKSKCACWQLTLEGARTIRMGEDVGYVYKRLPKPLPSGIYECNSRCKCKHTCLNRVAQHPLQLKLQVFKTLNRGWGIRALNDVPEGSFLCVYAGNLLTDATANLDGLNEGDEYLAELDYIEVVEQMKEGYEDDIPKDIKKLDKKELGRSDSEEEESSSSSSDEEKESKAEPDDDFQPGYLGAGVLDFTKRLRKRDKNKDTNKKTTDQETEKGKDNTKDKEEKSKNGDEDCITISDDESREPSCFTAAAGMGGSEFISKYRSVRSLFGEDEACYIMDAKVQGNIGRYLNHSCSPNVFVQNVFVDTHDPRFPWVAFFALNHIRAGTELTWNYNYDVGSVPGKVLYCYCAAPNCRGRLL